MKDIDFEILWIPNSYAACICRHAVLYPLVDRVHSVGQLRYQIYLLIKKWRQRAADLRNEGWGATSWQDKANNCLPAFCYTRQRPQPCCQRTVCPFCYAREVVHIWDVIRQAAGVRLRSDDEKERLAIDYEVPAARDAARREYRCIDIPGEAVHYHLIERRHRVNVRYHNENAAATPTAWLRLVMQDAVDNRRDRMRRLQRRGMLGAFSTLKVSTDTARRGGWCLQLCELYMVQPGTQLPPDLPGRQRVHTKLTARVVANAVSRVCAYPTRLLSGDTPMTVELLNACAGLRRTAYFGTFRGADSE